MHGRNLNLSDISETTFNLQQTANSIGITQTGAIQPFIQAPVIQDVADFGNFNGPQLMISQERTNAVLSLFKVMIVKGK